MKNDVYKFFYNSENAGSLPVLPCWSPDFKILFPVMRSSKPVLPCKWYADGYAACAFYRGLFFISVNAEKPVPVGGRRDAGVIFEKFHKSVFIRKSALLCQVRQGIVGICQSRFHKS